MGVTHSHGHPKQGAGGAGGAGAGSTYVLAAAQHGTTPAATPKAAPLRDGAVREEHKAAGDVAPPSGATAPPLPPAVGVLAKPGITRMAREASKRRLSTPRGGDARSDPGVAAGAGRDIGRATPVDSPSAGGDAVPATSPAPGSTSAAAAAPRPVTLVSDTRIEMHEMVHEAHVDNRGKLHAGELLKWIDICACLSAEMLAQRACVTATMDDLRLGDDITRGDLVILEAQVNEAWNTSMEVGVRVDVERLESGERFQVCSAYCVFVVLRTPEDGAKRPRVPRVAVESPEAAARKALAAERRSIRLGRKALIESYTTPFENECGGAGPTAPEGGDMFKDATTTAVGTTSDAAGDRASKPVAESRVEFAQLVLPPHANHMGNTFGGQVMAWMAAAGTTAAYRHARAAVRVTEFTDVYFVAPSTVGDRVFVYSAVNRAFETTMEVGVRVEATGSSGVDPRLIAKSYMIFELAAGGDASEPGLLPLAVPETPDQCRRWSKAQGRRAVQLVRRGVRSGASGLSWEWRNAVAPELTLLNVQSLLELAAWRGWSLVHHVDNMWLHRTERKGIICCRLEFVTTAAARQVFAYLHDHNNRKEWDVLFKGGEVRVTIDDRNDISWLALGDRDFALLRSWRSDDCTHVLASHSVLHDAVPVVEGVKRGEVLSSGFVITPVLAPAVSGSVHTRAHHDNTQASADGLAHPPPDSTPPAGGGEVMRGTRVIYCVQLGPSALRLAIADLVGPDKPMVKSLLALRRRLTSIPPVPA